LISNFNALRSTFIPQCDYATILYWSNQLSKLTNFMNLQNTKTTSFKLL
jgi:hypothetical protein